MVLKRIVFLSLGLMICLSSFSQSKLINAGKSGKVSGTVKTDTPKPKTSTKKHVTSLDNKSDAVRYMDIKDISFANADNHSNIINDYGTDLFAGDIKYLIGKVHYNGLLATAKDITLFVKIIKEDGSVMAGEETLKGYTFKTDVRVEPGVNKSLDLLGYGDNLLTYFSPGQYNYEVWYNGNVLFQKRFRLYSGTTPLVNHKFLKIHSVKFMNTDNYSAILNGNEIQNIKPQISYEGLSLNNQNVTFMVRVVLPDGNIAKGTDSPLGFTYKEDFLIKSGANTSLLNGWKNEAKTFYDKGTYKYEIWLDGSKICETDFTINDKNGTLNEKGEVISFVSSHNNDRNDDYSSLVSNEDKQKTSNERKISDRSSNSFYDKHDVIKKHRFALDLGIGAASIVAYEYDYTTFSVSTAMRYVYNISKNIGVEADLSIMSDFQEVTAANIFVGPRLSTSPSRKKISLYFAPKIGYGDVCEGEIMGLSYELELGLNIGRNLFVSWSCTGVEESYEETYSFVSSNLRLGVYF